MRLLKDVWPLALWAVLAATNVLGEESKNPMDSNFKFQVVPDSKVPPRKEDLGRFCGCDGFSCYYEKRDFCVHLENLVTPTVPTPKKGK